MTVNRTRLPAHWSLRHQVIRGCGPGTRFAELGHRFGDWLQLGHDAAPATVGEVEQRIAGYLDLAAGVGRRWGLRVGATVGALGALALVLIGLVAR